MKNEHNGKANLLSQLRKTNHVDFSITIKQSRDKKVNSTCKDTSLFSNISIFMRFCTVKTRVFSLQERLGGHASY